MRETTIRRILLGSQAACGKLRLFVPFTTARGTRAVLNTAETLAGDLAASVDLVAVQVVQLPCPLRPDSRTLFLRDQLHVLTAGRRLPIAPRVVLTRDNREAFHRLLPPESVVLMPKPRWFTGEARLARQLRQAGHNVLTV